MHQGPFYANWNEDGSATVLARLTARTGSGTATGEAGEGNWLKIVDVSTITYNVYDLDGTTPTTAISSGSLTVASVVIDTPVTANTLWTFDTVGYNFLHDLAANTFPDAHRYRLEYTVTLSGGAVVHGIFEGPAREVWSS